MTTTKYQMTRAAALRIARVILKSGYPTDYEGDVLAALAAEGFSDCANRVEPLLTELRKATDEVDHPEARRAIELIAFSCANECRRAREVLRDLRRGMRGLGLIFEDDVKREALKD